MRLCAFCFRECCSAVAKVVSATAIAAIFIVILLDGSELVVRNLDPRVQQWIAERIGADEVTVGSVSLNLGQGPAGVTLNDIRVGGAEGAPEIEIPQIVTGFNMLDTLQRGVRPQTVEVSGVALSLLRGEDGAVQLIPAGGGPGAVLIGGGDAEAAPPDFGALMTGLTQAADIDMLSELETLSIEDVSLEYADRRSGHVWRSDTASAKLRREAGALSGSLRADLRDAEDRALTVLASFSRNDATGETRYAVRFENARPADIAEQVGVLGWLGVIDAPVDGSIAAVFADDGALRGLSGQLRMGAGAVTPLPEREIGFAGASAYFSYDPETEIFTVDRLDIDSAYGSLAAEGEVAAGRDDATGEVTTLTGQMSLSEVVITAAEYVAEPVAFPEGEIVARVAFDPFRIDIGEASLRDGATRLALKGSAEPAPTHWSLALDAQITEIGYDRTLQLWPETLRPNLRRWLATRLTGGRFAALRGFYRQGETGSDIGLDFAFDGASARILPRMPELVDASGTGQLIGNRFDIVLDTGRTGPGPGEGIDLAGSRFSVADARTEPVMGTVELLGTGAVPDFLRLIDNPPLRLMTRAGTGTDLARGSAAVAASLTLPLIDDLDVDEVKADVTATLFDVASDSLIPGRPLAADELRLDADNNRLEVAGDVRVAGVPMTARYSRGLTRADGGAATVEGQMAVTRDGLAALGIDLPHDSFKGTGQGRFALDLRPETPPRYTAEVGLAGASIAIPAIGWSKSEGAAGRLSLAGRLGDAPTVERIALDGPGLALDGRLQLTGDTLTGATLSRLRLGSWLDAPVRWQRQGRDHAQVEITGGRIDLRGGTPRSLSGGGAGGGADIEFAPDEVIVADGIRLTGTRGRLTGGSGGQGRFSARVNGKAPIDGVIRPGGRIYVQSEDGGAALRAAGIYRNARGGKLRVSLAPTGREGQLSGALSLQRTRVVNAPALAEVLTVASILGIADKLTGPGIGFDDVQARFLIDGDSIYVSSARAVGPSLGVTLRGNYNTRREALQMDGVVSPLYMVNGLFERLPLIGRALGGRPGEGLLGATFTLRGRADDPTVTVNPLSVLTPGATREMLQSRSRTSPGG